MEYKDIILSQKQKLSKELQWWVSFFYHFTDVHNAVNILKKGWIMSRKYVSDSGIMENDNASKAVIQATNTSSKNYGRLYFRPLTPTQYHNEGFKPKEIRNTEIDASCPVPVFLCLSSLKTLQYPGTEFAEKGIAGNRHNIQSGEDAFSQLNFSKIYHNTWYDTKENSDIKEYRLSEVIRENGFPLEPLLQCILCRSIAEKETFLYLIKVYSLRMYNTYKDKIFYLPKYQCFFNNGIFIKKAIINEQYLTLTLNESENRLKTKSSVYFLLSVELVYKKNNGEVLLEEIREKRFNYCKIQSVFIELRKDFSYDSLYCKVLFDGEIMYENEFYDLQCKLL